MKKSYVVSKKGLDAVVNALQEANSAISFNVEVNNIYALNVITDKEEIQCTCHNPLVIEKFILDLKKLSPEHANDLEKLISNLDNLVIGIGDQFEIENYFKRKITK